jgi:thioredoxin 1
MVHAVSAASEITAAPLAIVDFWATWCGPCQSAAPHFQRLASDFPRVAFMKVDVDDHEDIATAYGVRTLPTFIVFKNGTPVETIKGFNTAKIVSALNKITGQ